AVRAAGGRRLGHGGAQSEHSRAGRARGGAGASAALKLRQEIHQRLHLVRPEGSAVGGHVVAAVENSPGELVRGQAATDVAQVWAAVAACPRHGVAGLAAFGPKELGAMDSIALE